MCEESPFNHALNPPPPGYLEVDRKLPPNPTKLNPQDVPLKNLPLAGHLSEIGQKILELGSKKAVYVTTLNWGIGTKDEKSPETQNITRNNHFEVQRPNNKMLSP